MKPYSYVFLLFFVIILTCVNCIRGERQEPISMQCTNVDSNVNNLKSEMHSSGFRSPIDNILNNAEDTISAIRYLMDLRTLPSPEQFDSYLKSEFKRRGSVIQKAGITLGN